MDNMAADVNLYGIADLGQRQSTSKATRNYDHTTIRVKPECRAKNLLALIVVFLRLLPQK